MCACDAAAPSASAARRVAMRQGCAALPPHVPATMRLVQRLTRRPPSAGIERCCRWTRRAVRGSGRSLTLPCNAAGGIPGSPPGGPRVTTTPGAPVQGRQSPFSMILGDVPCPPPPCARGATVLLRALGVGCGGLSMMRCAPMMPEHSRVRLVSHRVPLLAARCARVLQTLSPASLRSQRRGSGESRISRCTHNGTTPAGVPGERGQWVAQSCTL